MGFFEVFAGALAAFYAVIPSYGLAIILLTIAARVLLLPLSIKQTKSMREMQVIQPEVKKIQTKHKSDPQKRNEEMMKLYKEHGVNPFGGCLPLLMQMPVFIGLYQVIRFNLRYMEVDLLSDTALAHALRETPEAVNRFLGVFRLDCSLTQAWSGTPSEAVSATCGSGSPIFAVLPYVLLIALMGFTTYYQQRQMMANRGPHDQQAQQMQMVGRIMPFILVVFGLQFPAGVVVYWVATNVWTIVQQRIILAKFGPMPAPGPAPAKKDDKKDGKVSTKPGSKSTSRTGAKNATKSGAKKATASAGVTKPSNAQSGNGSTRSRAGKAGASSGKKKRKR